MRAVISSTYDNLYYFFLPITVFCWNKIGVDVICMMPDKPSRYNYDKYLEWAERSMLIHNTILKQGLNCEFKYFVSDDDKQATYAQCSRLYAAAMPELHEDDILISGDIDMAIFGEYLKQKHADFDIFGKDLCPDKQYPICFISATVKNWLKALNMQYGSTSLIKDSPLYLNTKTYQQCLDDLLGHIQCESFKGNYWGKDQETAYDKISSSSVSKYYHNRAKEGTQFATKRYDRDDSFLLERLSPDTVDFHMPRPGYEDKNFDIIKSVLKYHYPDDDLTWIDEYCESYKKLI